MFGCVSHMLDDGTSHPLSFTFVVTCCTLALRLGGIVISATPILTPSVTSVTTTSPILIIWSSAIRGRGLIATILVGTSGSVIVLVPIFYLFHIGTGHIPFLTGLVGLLFL